MKTTRRIFVVTGKEEVVQNILSEVNGFKAINVIDGIANTEDIQNTFNCNKNVLCRGVDKNSEFYKLIPIFISGRDSDTKIKFNNIIDVRDNILLQFMRIAEKYNADIGDHKSNSTSFENTSNEDCPFCKLLNGNPVHYQAPVYESKNFMVVPGSGAFTNGYLIILPKDHVMSCAELSSEKLAELHKVIKDVKYLVKAVYGKRALVWENGSGTDGLGKAKTSIVHAHVHVCPSYIDIIQTIKVLGINLSPVKKEELANYNKDPYLLVINYDNKYYMNHDNQVYIPRQFVRQLIAIEHGVTNDLWDWRKYPYWSNVEKTGNTVLDYIRKNFSNLPKRIQDATAKFI